MRQASRFTSALAVALNESVPWPIAIWESGQSPSGILNVQQMSVAGTVTRTPWLRRAVRRWLLRVTSGNSATSVYHNLFHALPDAVLVIDPDRQRIAEANGQARELLGCEPRHSSLDELAAVLADVEQPDHEQLMNRARLAALGTPQRYEVRAALGERPLWCEIDMVGAALRGHWQVVLTIRDITARKEAEEKQRQLEAQVRHVQKLESLGVLAGGIAHDFNNLLAGILGNAGLALRDLPDQSQAADRVKQLQSAAVRASELTGQMLAYSGKGTFLVEALDLSRVSLEMASLLSASVNKKAELVLDLDDHLPAMEGDATQIRQVVMNLLTNASDALEDGPGTIRVRTGRQTLERGYLSLTYLDEDLPSGEYVFLEVSDTGCGMERETVAKIFDPFFTTKFTGRGLGLATVLGIIRSHRGAIRVYSEPGHGTRVRVLFPATTRVVELPVGPAADGTPWNGHGIVLVVDDEPTVREVAAAILMEAGFDVLQAVDGADGLRLFESQADQIRAVLLDLTMPQISGEQVCAEIAKLRPEAKVVLSSGYSEQDAMRRIDGDSVAGFVQKPYGPRELIQAIRAALGE